ncbi:hypothetical protein [Streptomyces silvensis]|uniref:Uncharacterized protein n=1 Tax=Streptomyces silvensis TaxID=1765722 RepID=A0A0W7X561_9ACTN|nr:hypothetical protein [Streptomyces silvensis]KUF17847.1 hypothetical protein AT728_10790 [Streptomyces silvensis]
MTGRRLRAALAATVLVATLGGCGIRSTEVPTDFGPAPSRVPCVASSSGVSTQDEATGVPVQIFLVCASQLVTVDRTVRIPSEKATTDRVRIAQTLLDELSAPPSQTAKQAGYETDVRRGITVSGPQRGDPDVALRLSTRPADLSSLALAQIVCTYADGAVADSDGTVVLGGLAGTPLLRYECTQAVRSRPGTVAPPSQSVER